MLKILTGDWVEQLRTLPDESVQCCVTSPPYWGLRSYLPQNHPLKSFELGNERRIEEYIEKIVCGFSDVRRVLRKDGTLWMNMGDCYANDGKWGGETGGKHAYHENDNRKRIGREKKITGLKPKDLVGMPWRVAFALQADGWWLRMDNIWNKPNPMPESVSDRTTRSHEYVFHFSKSAHYFYDIEAVKEPVSLNTHARISQDLANQVGSHRANGGGKTNGPMKAVIAGSTRKLAGIGQGKRKASYETALCLDVPSRNKRSVWTIPTAAYSGSHYATFPPDLVRPCILAGTSAKGCCRKCGSPYRRIVKDGPPLEDWKRQCGSDANGEYHGENQKPYSDHQAQAASTVKERILKGMVEKVTVGWKPGCKCDVGEPVACVVLDPFLGSGTTGMVALELGRDCVGIELDPASVEQAASRNGLFVQG